MTAQEVRIWKEERLNLRAQSIKGGPGVAKDSNFAKNHDPFYTGRNLLQAGFAVFPILSSAFRQVLAVNRTILHLLVRSLHRLHHGRYSWLRLHCPNGTALEDNATRVVQLPTGYNTLSGDIAGFTFLAE